MLNTYPLKDRFKRVGFLISSSICFLSIIFSIFFYFKILERNKYIDNVIKSATMNNHPHKRQDIVLSISNEIYKRTNKRLDINDLGIYERFESTSFFNLTPAVCLKYGGYGISGQGSCGTMSRVLLNALWRKGIPARKLQLLDKHKDRNREHTMVEFYDDEKWLVISPSDDSFVWRKKNKEIATVAEIKNNIDLFNQIYKTKPVYPCTFDNTQNIRWEKLPPNIVKFIRIFLGEESFNKMETPKLYDMPRTLFFILSLGLALLSAIVAIIISRSVRHKR